MEMWAASLGIKRSGCENGHSHSNIRLQRVSLKVSENFTFYLLTCNNIKNIRAYRDNIDFIHIKTIFSAAGVSA
jgi:hypothetical protein